MVVEVKDRDLSLQDIQSSVTKILEGSSSAIRSLIFVVPGIVDTEQNQVQERIESEYARGVNVYHVRVEALAKATFMLLDEEHRVSFVRLVGELLDQAGHVSHRAAWRDLLRQE